jgi:hypothetical protein
MDRRNQLLLTSQLSGETTSELPLVTDGHQTKENRMKKIPADSPPRCLKREITPFPIQPKRTTLKRGRGTKKPHS